MSSNVLFLIRVTFQHFTLFVNVSHVICSVTLSNLKEVEVAVQKMFFVGVISLKGMEASADVTMLKGVKV